MLLGMLFIFIPILFYPVGLKLLENWWIKKLVPSKMENHIFHRFEFSTYIATYSETSEEWTCLGPSLLSFVERLSSFGGYFVQNVYRREHLVCLCSLFRSVLYQSFHSIRILQPQLLQRLASICYNSYSYVIILPLLYYSVDENGVTSTYLSIGTSHNSYFHH